MTLTLELVEEQEAALRQRAQAEGVSAEQYAHQVIVRDLESTISRPIFSAIRELWSDMPADVRGALPSDGIDQIDHYVYGTPKRDQ